MLMVRKTPRISPSSVYLGEYDKRKEREARLEAIARANGLKGRSELIQYLADGKLAVCPPTEAIKQNQ